MRLEDRVAIIVSSILAAAGARAAEDSDATAPLAEVIVTAEKRSEDLQRVPVSMQALQNRALQELLVTSFDDYAKYLPSLSSTNYGPGHEQLAIRGVNNGFDADHVGSQSTVAIYLDEQPVTTIGANLDVHIYDIERVEELSGPQGTLFGASSMAGTLRIITNKPSPKGFEAGYDLDANDMPEGSPGGRFEGFVNIPVSDAAALRLVAFSEHDGGFINNVLGPPETWPTSGVVLSNAGLTHKDFNAVNTSGGRAALKIDFDDSWSVLPSLIGQKQVAYGVPAYEPGLGDLDIARYAPDRRSDDWWQAALTIEGRIADLNVIYAGAYLKRNVHQQLDYAQYYYDYDVAYEAMPQYYGDNFRNNAGQLIPPATVAIGSDTYTKVSHELRVSSPSEWRLRFVAGLFLQHQIDDFIYEYWINGLAAIYSITNYPGLYYLADMTRIDRDRAAFGEVSFDLARQLTLTAGIREFGYDNTVWGFFGYNGQPNYEGFTYPSGEQLCAAGSASVAHAPAPCIDANERATHTGSTYKLNLTYHIDADRMLYGTWSTGFRPGGINRVRGALPYGPDSLVNFELGWKSEWWGHRLRFNGAAFYERWKNPQFEVCGPNCVPEVINAGSAAVRGVETELAWNAARGLMLSAAATWLDARLTANACTYGSAGALCNNAQGVPDPTVLPAGTDGQRLPAPPFKGNLIARYTFALGGFTAHVQGAEVALSSAPPQLPAPPGGLQPGNMPPYFSLDLASGLGRGSWTSELYVKNVFDRRGEENRFYLCNAPSCNQLFVIPIPPRTIGVTFRQRL
jgi:iron complex outermembrane receptor protein